MSMAMGVLLLQATLGGQMGQAAAMAKAMAMVAGAEQDSWAATSDAAGPERLWTVEVLSALKGVAAVLKAMGMLPLLSAMRGWAMGQAATRSTPTAMAAVEELAVTRGPTTAKAAVEKWEPCTATLADAGLDR